ncbi:hypothetical protein FB45DRAFT_1091299, partial [Roridomyces roridus]
GSYQHDVDSKEWPLCWESWEDFHSWRKNEEQSKCIELLLDNTYPPTFRDAPTFTKKCRYICSRGGKSRQPKPSTDKEKPARTRKNPSKRIDCQCIVMVKEYPDTSKLLGYHVDTHNHELGNANLRFTRIPPETREYIAGLLRLK